jgi:hypothetical protein
LGPFFRRVGPHRCRLWQGQAIADKIVERFNNGVTMATVNFSVPDQIKESFNATFAGRNKSAIVAELMREAVEREASRQRSQQAVERIMNRRPKAPLRSASSIAVARRTGRP